MWTVEKLGRMVNEVRGVQEELADHLVTLLELHARLDRVLDGVEVLLAGAAAGAATGTQDPGRLRPDWQPPEVGSAHRDMGGEGAESGPGEWPDDGTRGDGDEPWRLRC